MNLLRPRAVGSVLPIVLAAVVACTPVSPGPSPSISSAARPSASVASTAPRSVSGSAVNGAWQRTWPGGADRRRALTAIVAIDGGFVVTGSDRVSKAPAAMSSADGISWADDTIGGENIDPSVLAAWGDRAVAVGAGQVPCAHPYGLDSWVRSGGGVWAEAPFDDLFCRGSDVRLGFVAGRPILVGSGPGDAAVVWSSVDGLRWVDHSQAFVGLMPRAVTGDGRTAMLFAVGPTGTWVSTTTDGATWSAPAMIPGLPVDLVIHGAFWIDGAPTLIVSAGDVVDSIRPDDGGAWRRATAEGLTADELRGVTAFDGGLLAVSGENGIEALVSRDGMSWHPIELPHDLGGEDASVAGLAVGGARAVLIGSLTDAVGSSVGAIWTGPDSLVAP